MVEGIREAAVTRWFAEHVPAAQAPLQFSLIAGGHSNLTYAVTDAIDDTLVQVLLDPLLTPGASDVVFDTISYSAGPLPEQQLRDFPPGKPVWICYGRDDPWTPAPRVESLLDRFDAVGRVVGWKGVGHCPHDEAPELVHPLLLEYLAELRRQESPQPVTISAATTDEDEMEDEDDHKASTASSSSTAVA